MARRKSGDIRIRLEWVDAENQWRCVVSATFNEGTEFARPLRTVVWVGRAPADRLAVDCSEAYDETARAALAFASQPDADASDDERLLASEINDRADFTDTGFAITREA